MEDDDTSRHKRQRISPPLTPNIDDEDDMGVMSAGRESRAASDASSDWGDWADRQVAQGETPADNAAEAAGQSSAVDSSGENEEDDVWVRKQMEQPSAVLGADNRAWDYVLQQMILDEGEARQEESWAATAASLVQGVRGAAAVELVSRWLRSNLPIALPSFNTFGLVSAHPGSGGRVVVDSLAAPSVVAVVSCSPEQNMHRVNLFSLSANAGAALAAALIQPGAAGLLPTAASSRETEAHSSGGNIGELSGAHPHGVGVVFESLDSRIHMDSLVSAMGRLGLGVKCRSRSGLWKLRPGAVLLPTAESNVKITPLAPEDASFVSSCCALQGVVGAEALVRGLIRRNPSAGIRRGNQLTAWCLSLDGGLAGALHVAPSHLLSCLRNEKRREEEEEGFSPQNLVLAILGSVLAQPSDAELPTAHNATNDSLGREGAGAGASTTRHQPDLLDLSAQRRPGLTAVVVDDESPFVGLFQELGLLERVCDADWVRFEPVACHTGSGRGSGAPAVVLDRDGSLGGEHRELPLAAMVMQP